MLETGIRLGGSGFFGIEAVRKLGLEIGIPQRLRELGVKREGLPAMAAKAARIERLMRIEARAVAEGAALTILENAF